MAFTLLLWLAATAAHIHLSAVAARTLTMPANGGRRDLTEWIFVSTLLVVAGLSSVVHVTAITTGLSLGSGVAGLAIWHALVSLLAARQKLRSMQAIEALLWNERLALTVLGAILASWVAMAAASDVVQGPDATHYHVPHALNIARGVGLFDLPATPHLYPLAGSAITAWFIIATGQLLLVDLAMALPFVLLAASLCRLFRSLTGLSGIAWASWLVLVLFSTPMFRSSAMGSADLWFAAAFAAVLSVVVDAWSRGRWEPKDLWMLGAAAGLLLGSKTTGAAAFALLAGAAGLAELVKRWLRPGVRGSWRTAPALAGAAVLMIAAGGVWLVRNWVQFGSPLAPLGLQLFGVEIFPGESAARGTYYSILAELESGSIELVPAALRHIARWFGPWFLIALAPVALYAGDLGAAVLRRRIDDRWVARAGALFVTLTAGSVLIWLLIGAPWTALERSGGLTLRYILPLAALLPLLAFTGFFPQSIPWFLRPGARHVAAALLAASSVVMFVRSLTSSPDPLPGLHWTGGVFVAAVALWTRVRPSQVAIRRLILVSAITAAVAGTAWMISSAERRTSAEALRNFESEDAEFAGGQYRGSTWRSAFLAVLTDERARGVRCESRRFYALTRNDEPLALQPPDYSSLVFYAARDIEEARAAGPLSRCDYIVTTDEMSATRKGGLLADALSGGQPLRIVPATGRFLVLTPIGRQ